MAIMVKYQDLSYGFEANRMVDELIRQSRIVAFRRSSGWAEIGRDPIRGGGAGEAFEGMERRGQAGTMNCLTCIHFVDSACRQTNCSARTSSQSKPGDGKMVF